MSSTLESLPEVLTIDQIAKYLGLSKRIVRKLLRTRVLRGRHDVQKWIVTKKALAEYLDGEGEEK